MCLKSRLVSISTLQRLFYYNQSLIYESKAAPIRIDFSNFAFDLLIDKQERLFKQGKEPKPRQEMVRNMVLSKLSLGSSWETGVKLGLTKM